MLNTVTYYLSEKKSMKILQWKSFCQPCVVCMVYPRCPQQPLPITGFMQPACLLRGEKYVYRLLAAAGKAHCYECIMITEGNEYLIWLNRWIKIWILKYVTPTTCAIKTTCLILCGFPFFSQNSSDPAWHSHRIDKDPVSWVVEPPWITLVPTHPPDAGSDWDQGNLVAGSMPWSLSFVSQASPQELLWCVRVLCPAGETTAIGMCHCHEGLCLVHDHVWVGGVSSVIQMDVSQNNKHCYYGCSIWSGTDQCAV